VFAMHLICGLTLSRASHMSAVSFQMVLVAQNK